MVCRREGWDEVCCGVEGRAGERCGVQKLRERCVAV